MKSLKSLKRTFTIQGKLYEVDLSKVPKQDIEKLKESFNSLDKEQTGTIGVEEILQFLENCGLPSNSEEVIENYFEDIEKDNDYQLDFTEFCMRFAPRTEIVEDKVIKAFRNFAPSKEKFIGVMEIKKILMHLSNSKFSQEEFDETMKYLGLNNNDKIEYEEFVKLWREKVKVFE